MQVMALNDFLGHVICLLVLVLGRKQGYQGTARIFCPQSFLLPPIIMADNFIGSFQNVPGRTIILFQPDNLGLRIIPFKIQDILDICSPEAVHRLVIITHHTNVPVPFRKEPDQPVLSMIGILVLIHEDILKLIAVSLQYIAVIAEQDIGIHQQVVEIHAVPGTQPVLVALVYLEEPRAPGHTVVFQDLRISCIHRRCDQAVLRP